ncbi:MAG: Asp/Glu racemase [Marinibacterium sp.]|nr:Asp/Glu racemase [Marinibacterium sp.]
MKLDVQTDDGIGTRARLGLIVLEADETIESDLSRMLRLDGVALFVSRIPMVAEIRPETLARMERDLPASAALFPAARLNGIGYGCTSAATVIGSDHVARAIQSTRPQTPVTDPLAALIAGARHLGACRLGFVTPYIPEVSAGLRTRLHEAGFDIAGFGSFEEMNDAVVARITPGAILAAIETVAAQAPCDAIVVSCTNLRALDVIAEAEARTGVPVLTSNQALGWHLLRRAGLADTQAGLGRLWMS